MSESKSIIITPTGTLVNDQPPMEPDFIHIILESGTMFTIDETIALLEQHDKKKRPKIPFKTRIKNGFSAFKKAYQETYPEGSKIGPI